MPPKRKFCSIPRMKKKFRDNQYQKKEKNVETDTSRKEDSVEVT